MHPQLANPAHGCALQSSTKLGAWFVRPGGRGAGAMAEIGYQARALVHIYVQALRDRVEARAVRCGVYLGDEDDGHGFV